MLGNYSALIMPGLLIVGFAIASALAIRAAYRVRSPLLTFLLHGMAAALSFVAGVAAVIIVLILGGPTWIAGGCIMFAIMAPMVLPFVLDKLRNCWHRRKMPRYASDSEV